MASMTFVLREPSSKTPQPINALLRWDGQRLKFSTGLKVNPKHWNFEKYRVKNVLDAVEKDAINELLSNLEKEGDRVITKLKAEQVLIDSAYLKQHFENFLNPPQIEEEATPQQKFFSFITQFVEDSNTGRRKNHNDGKLSIRSIQRYKTVETRLREFSEVYDRVICFNTIDEVFYSDFVEWLQKSKSYSKNNIGKYITTLKSIMNYALEKGQIEKLEYRTNKFKAMSEDSDNVYLTEKELQKIYDLDLSGNERLGRVRDLFIVGAFTGLRFSDLTNINKNDIKTDDEGDQFIELEQQKTEDPVTVPVLPMVKTIFEKYNYSLPSISNQKMNDYIKEVCQLASIEEKVTKRITKGGLRVVEYLEKWEMITTHTARRSFATNAYLKGVDTLSIMAVTGHKTEKSFMKYIKITHREKAKRFKLAWLKSSESGYTRFGNVINLTA
ncbi:tyrosine-type recombinase/integrase [Cellulophaga sp. BC115SP]|nr:tyrosine-type recombinase/integrase [Cellulophaga sp. BC115SP]